MSFSFQEGTRAFDLRNASFLAEMAEAVYEPAEKLERLARSDWDFTNFSFIDANDTQCLVANNRRMSVVAFRGTETKLSDWHTDAHVELVPGPLGGKVHAGFYDALGHVWREIEQQLDRFDPQQKTPLWVTGHSLGGALGVLAVARWIDSGRAVAGLYSFGQPRAGDRTFARNFNFAFKPFAFRFVNNDDLVTRSPPQLLGYSHQGTLKYIDADGRLQDGIEWWNLFLDRWKGRIESLFLDADNSLADHSMIIYGNRLKKVLAQIQPPMPDRLVRPRRRVA